ncbi:MAG: hypothetical protein [Caudoviricetes sp.]|nr:MAG: hypothetical protein [Caudoviricetes sp.]
MVFIGDSATSCWRRAFCSFSWRFSPRTVGSSVPCRRSWFSSRVMRSRKPCSRPRASFLQAWRHLRRRTTCAHHSINVFIWFRFPQ